LATDHTNGVQDVDRSLGDVVNRISENASTLVREEIELAKTEIELKAKKLARGAAVAVAAGFFLLLGLIFAFDAIAWGINDATGSLWLGFVIVFALLLVLSAAAGFFAYRSFKAGAPPTPDKAIEQAKLTKEAIEHPELEAPVVSAEKVKE
jgi:uncharacterized membrane protein YqjE